MSELQKILFILNPVSGNKRSRNTEQNISCVLKTNNDYCIVKTEHKCHATQIANNLSGNYSTVVAIGGDGTVNEVASVLINRKINFGIIPTGSGNGFARFFKIPADTEKAISIIKNNKIRVIDTIKVNDSVSVNLTGIGFDAHIAHLFAKSKSRGFLSYFLLVLKNYSKYKPEEYTIKYDNQELKTKAFLISFANSTQFGNNAHIAPLAIIDDGYLDICILQKIPFYAAPVIALRLFNKTIHKSKYYQTIRAKEIEILNPDRIQAHIDGEPVEFSSNMNLKIVPASLNVIVP